MVTVLGVLLLIIGLKTRPELFRFDFKGMWKYVAYQYLNLVLTAAIITKGLMIYVYSQMANQAFQFAPSDLILAGLEDCIFILPIFFIKNKYLRMIGLIALSVLFAYAHAYQGVIGMACKIFFVGIGYNLMKRHGVLTCIAGHALLDLLIVFVLN